MTESGPLGRCNVKTWYFDFNPAHRLFAFTINIRRDSSGSYHGDMVNEQGQIDQIEEIRWNLSQRRLVFRRKIDVYEWYNGTIVEGIIVGRFSHSTDTMVKPRFNPSTYSNHFTGWNSNYIDGKNIVPRVYDVTLDGNYRGILYQQMSWSSSN